MDPSIRIFARALALPLALLALVLPALAQAEDTQGLHGQPYTPDRTLRRYLRIANSYWHQPEPTCTNPDGTKETVHTLLYDDPDPGVAARAETPGCVIYLDRDFWPAPVDRIECTVIVHEWGHLLGYGHSPDPHNVMYETPTHGVPACDALARAAAAKRARKAKKAKKAKKHAFAQARARSRLRAKRHLKAVQRRRPARQRRHLVVRWSAI